MSGNIKIRGVFIPTFVTIPKVSPRQSHKQVCQQEPPPLVELSFLCAGSVDSTIRMWKLWCCYENKTVSRLVLKWWCVRQSVHRWSSLRLTKMTLWLGQVFWKSNKRTFLCMFFKGDRMGILIGWLIIWIIENLMSENIKPRGGSSSLLLSQIQKSARGSPHESSTRKSTVQGKWREE